MPRKALTDDDALFTPTEAAAYLRSNTRTLERWRTTGSGPAFVKIGRRVAYTGAALGKFVAAQTRRNAGGADR
jgi:hypothetical protein